jgi:hypothetical protein
MLRFVALSDKHPIFSVVLRYGIAIASSAAAFTVVFVKGGVKPDQWGGVKVDQ